MKEGGGLVFVDLLITVDELVAFETDNSIKEMFHDLDLDFRHGEQVGRKNLRVKTDFDFTHAQAGKYLDIDVFTIELLPNTPP